VAGGVMPWRSSIVAGFNFISFELNIPLSCDLMVA